MSRRKDEKICGTCKHWMGKTKLAGSSVEIQEERSQCNHPTSKHGTTHATLKIGAGCSGWSQKYI